MTAAKKPKVVQPESLEREIKREWKHFLRFKDENRLLFAAFVMILAAIAVINAVYVVNASNREDRAQSEAVVNVQKTIPTQLPATTPAYSARVSGVALNDQQDRAFPIDSSETMLIFTLEITNSSGREQDLYPVKQLFVRDEEGRYSEPHASMFVTNPFPAGKIQPGETVSGQLSFAVSKTAIHQYFYLDTGWNGQVPTVYDLSK